MRKQLVWLLAILTLTALVSSAQRAPRTGGQPPTPCPPAQPSVPEDPDWSPSGLLNYGEVVHSERPPSSLEPGKVCNPEGTIYFSVDLGEGDYRWTRFGPLEARVEGRTITLECQVSRYNKAHIQNYVPSIASVGPAMLSGLKGRYEIVLGDNQVGSATFFES